MRGNVWALLVTTKVDAELSSVVSRVVRSVVEVAVEPKKMPIGALSLNARATAVDSMTVGVPLPENSSATSTFTSPVSLPSSVLTISPVKVVVPRGKLFCGTTTTTLEETSPLTRELNEKSYSAGRES